MNLIRHTPFTGPDYAADQMEGSTVQQRQNASHAPGACRSDEDGSFQGGAVPNPNSARRRKAETERRLRWLEGRWNDEAYFRRMTEAGRYLQFCMLMEWASEADAAANSRLVAAESLSFA